eukprot:Blabericola_migrator_1__3032@NODE_1882_length_3608_cov_169_778029_g1205_i0_p2_GENE_NODE_1882_length_3608_cov_169_778029_g1205_i0NODE_1882_length_3608_cov_169_778029_g1205_i0_p2_ORF_typecomplete_len282_score35_14_NODE_1882_length_3608_cov_169_778029_g1205_i0115960
MSYRSLSSLPTSVRSASQTRSRRGSGALPHPVSELAYQPSPFPNFIEPTPSGGRRTPPLSAARRSSTFSDGSQSRNWLPPPARQPSPLLAPAPIHERVQPPPPLEMPQVRYSAAELTSLELGNTAVLAAYELKVPWKDEDYTKAYEKELKIQVKMENAALMCKTSEQVLLTHQALNHRLMLLNLRKMYDMEIMVERAIREAADRDAKLAKALHDSATQPHDAMGSTAIPAFGKPFPGVRPQDAQAPNTSRFRSDLPPPLSPEEQREQWNAQIQPEDNMSNI